MWLRLIRLSEVGLGCFRLGYYLVAQDIYVLWVLGVVVRLFIGKRVASQY